MHIGPPLVSMDLYLRREKGNISGVIHDMRAGQWSYISGLDQLLLYLDAVINEEPGRPDALQLPGDLPRGFALRPVEPGQVHSVVLPHTLGDQFVGQYEPPEGIVLSVP